MDDLFSTPAPAGHNKPPPYDPAVLEACNSKAREFLDAGGEWTALGDITTDEQSQKLTDFVTGLRGVYRHVEDARKAQKKPHDDAGKAVTGAFSPLLEALERIVDRVKPMQERWLRKKEADARAEQARLQAEARAKQQLAEQAAAAAASRNDALGEVEAERLKKEADALTKTAAAPVKVQAGSATGGGRAMTMREVRSGRIDNLNKVFMHFREEPDVLAFFQRKVDAAFRANGGETITIPGATLITQKVAV